MNLANKLTLTRIILAFLFMFFLLIPGPVTRIMALVLFVTAMFTDLFDGRIARQRHMVTNLGKLMDPLADKILVAAAFISFVQIGIVSAWMVVLIISREFCVTGLRLIASSKGKIIPASRIGKHKTFWQMFVITTLIVFLLIRDFVINLVVDTKILDVFNYWFNYIVLVMMLFVVGITLVSGYIYVTQNITLFEE